jgi:very-short-patch-repair endonuclease
VLATLDAVLRSGTCTAEDLAAACAAQRGLRGIAAVAPLVPSADARAESPMESRMRWRFLDAGLPAPQLQVEVGGPGRRHRVDLGWEERLLAAEFDGLTAHMTRHQLADDRDRHNWLTDRGWRLLHFTGVDVYRRADAMVATVRRHLDRSRPVIMAP